ncbi:MAG: stage II sporulation protein P [Chitinophagales bacterium]
MTRRNTGRRGAARPPWVLWWLCLGLFLAGAFPVVAAAAGYIPHVEGGEYYTIVSDKGETLAKMANSVAPGDYLVTEDNRGFRVVSVRGRVARARFDKWVDLNVAEDHPPLRERVSGWIGRVLAQVGGGAAKSPTIGIYHTHSDESYQPSVGSPSLPTGDIYKVGTTLADALRRRGFSVEHSLNNHNPHDGAAYHRSRRTVAELMRRGPTALIDVHRDAIPDASYYRRQVAGETIAQVRLVVGQQNQNRAVNFDFAKQIKATANRIHPGLVKEIFWARGNYNQDVSPRAILFEFGTHLNSQQMAKRGAALMGDVLPVVLTGKRTATAAPRPHARVVRAQNSSAGSSALWIVLAAIAGVALFLVINAGGLKGIGNQMKKFTGQELSGFLGRYRGGAKGVEGDKTGERRGETRGGPPAEADEGRPDRPLAGDRPDE